LLETTTIANAIVTAEAMGCQKDTAWAAWEHHAYYLLTLKDNHPTLHEDVQNHFNNAQKVNWELRHGYTQTFDKEYRREEVWQCWVLAAPEWLYERSSWRDLKSINGIRSEQTRYFLTSLPLDAERALRAARYHWGNENGWHRVLDTAFDEDASRARLKNAQATWVVLRHMAISLLEWDKTLKVGVGAKRKRAD
jgi:predicted transposase YbfD/YdcC